MFCKLFVFAVVLVAFAFANPEPQPGYLAGAAIASPFIARAPVAYGAYGAGYAAPIAYRAYGGFYGRTIYG